MRQIGDRLHKAFVAPAGQLAEQKGEYNRDDNADCQVQKADAERVQQHLGYF